MSIVLVWGLDSMELKSELERLRFIVMAILDELILLERYCRGVDWWDMIRSKFVLSMND